MIENLTIRVGGMTCSLCALKIEDHFGHIEGIKKISVNFATEKVILEYDTDDISLEKITQNIQNIGFKIINDEDMGLNSCGANNLQVRLKRLTIAAILLSLPSVIMMLVTYFSDIYYYFAGYESESSLSYIVEDMLEKTLPLHNWKFQLALATVVQFVIGYRFYRNSYYALKSRRPDMDVLVALGTSAAYFYSIYISLYRDADIFGMKPVYYEASITIITLVMIGKYLEAKAKGKTSQQIGSLTALKPVLARVLRPEGEVEVRAESVFIGDTVVVKPGEIIPADGIIIEGYCAIDESMLTGESSLIEKKPGQKVVSASINTYGYFKFRAEQVGKDTYFSKIIKMVEEGQGSKAPIQKIADKVCGIFVPIVLIISAATFLIWYFLILGRSDFSKALLTAVSVLVVSCPCALGLATPTAIIVGLGKAAQNGILIKNGEKLEAVCKLDMVVFDKTGTLTNGKPLITEILHYKKVFASEKEFLLAVASSEKPSEHPLGKAVYDIARKKYDIEPEEPQEFKALPGKGIAADVNGNKIIVGNEYLMKEFGIDYSKCTSDLNNLRNEGKTAVLIAVDNGIEGIFALSDSIKSDAKETIKKLKDLKIRVAMLTGDNKDTAYSIAKSLGIEAVMAEVLPHQKAEEINRLKRQGNFIAMAGDGINDAPALAAADIGVAMGTGSDIAIETGDIVLLYGNLNSIVQCVNISKATMRKIKQNLLWAFLYNSLGIPFTSMGFLSPVLSSAFMALSSISVLINSLSLRRIKLEKHTKHIGIQKYFPKAIDT
jgi:Cu+-exporting ATPase